ncbi:hypothetical protein REPUB_Repub05bG0151800 [Reevesia pubescens]
MVLATPYEQSGSGVGSSGGHEDDIMEYFGRVIAKQWSSFDIKGDPGASLKTKLIKLRCFIKQWNREVFGNVEKKIEKLETQLEELEAGGDYRDLSNEELEKIKLTSQELWEAQ